MEVRSALFVLTVLVPAVLGRLVATMPDMEEYETMIREMSTGDMKPDPETGSRVAASNTSHPEELGSYMEGDIMMSPVKSPFVRWPKGEVPYVISGIFEEDEEAVIQTAMKAFHKYTCIRFVPRTNHSHYVVIQSEETGCNANLGMQKKETTVVNLQAPECVTQLGTVLHELMHSIGLIHEHNRADRNTVVRINWAYVSKGKNNTKNNNFKKSSKYSGFGTPYDLHSVMHYSMFAESTDGSHRTITPLFCDYRSFNRVICKKILKETIGQRIGFSPLDVKKINTLYGCTNQV